jgi:hypothetical protein
MMFANPTFRTGAQRNDRYRNGANVYIEIGDSNAGGPVAEPVGFDSKYQSSDKVKIYFKPSQTSADDGTWQYYSTRSAPIANRRPGYPDPNPTFAVGADQSFVWEMGQQISLKRELRYFKYAVGGTTLLNTGATTDWYPDGVETDLFHILERFFIRKGLEDLYTEESICDVKIKGVVVRLGTNDCKTATWNQANFIAAIPVFCSTLRYLLGSQEIPIYWVQVNTNLASSPLGTWNSTNVSQCRTALSNCTVGGSTEISNFYLLNFDADPLEADGVHYTSDAFISQGEEYASTFIALGD